MTLYSIPDGCDLLGRLEGWGRGGGGVGAPWENSSQFLLLDLLAGIPGWWGGGTSTSKTTASHVWRHHHEQRGGNKHGPIWLDLVAHGHAQLADAMLVFGGGGGDLFCRVRCMAQLPHNASSSEYNYESYNFTWLNHVTHLAPVGRTSS